MYILVAVSSLLNIGTDKNPALSEAVSASLKKIAKKHPNEVLKSCWSFCNKNSKLNQEHVSVILYCMEDICRENILQIDGDTLLSLVEFAVEIMTSNVAHDPLIQMPSSGILVALGSKHSVQVGLN